jgi:hypothetical protein
MIVSPRPFSFVLAVSLCSLQDRPLPSRGTTQRSRTTPSSGKKRLGCLIILSHLADVTKDTKSTKDGDH